MESTRHASDGRVPDGRGPGANPGFEEASASAVERASHFDSEGDDRQLGRTATRIIVVASCLYALFHLAVLNFWAIDEWMYRVLHVNLGAIIAFVTLRGFPFEKINRVYPWDILLALAALGCTIYVGMNLNMLLMRAGVITTPGDFACGVIGTIVVLEFTRRTSGLVLPLIALAFISYIFLGPVLPGILRHSGFQTANAFSFLYSQDAIFGLTVAASSRYIIIFVAFAVFLQASGVGDYFMRVAMACFGWMRGGPGKVSVFSGLFFGTISGSAVANVVASGTFTIPLMRRLGYPKEDAGAIEATSSSGGQLVPPVMGAGAFIMAEITGIPYAEIILAAALPCLLFYAAVFVNVDKHAQRLGLHGVKRADLPRFSSLKGDVFLLLPLYVLLYLLLTGYSIIAAGTWGLVSTVLVMLARELKLHSTVLVLPLILYTLAPFAGYAINVASLGASLVSAAVIVAVALATGRGSWSVAPVLARTCLDGLSDTTRKSLQLISVMACAGIVVGVLGLTGLSGRFSSVLLDIAGDSTLVAFILAMVVSIILGMGMPTTAAYAIAASVVAPALQQMGVAPLAAHMFVFYCAVISAITPPVAIAAFAASALSGGKPWATSVRAMRFGMAAFLLPFMFYTSPEILLLGSVGSTVFVFATALVAVYLFATASEAYLFGPIGPLERLVALTAGILLLWANLASDVAGLALAAALFAWCRYRGGATRLA
ncbi:C4-dicarboxylate ABC transporter permease [Acuticoccus sediminis]|uniref:C4-dicarboxylate ABC transporter permease n=1 Tax=Acuticoccus sediminis TaxID=2184697 RepID=A0A8B2P139_9HYPH|nr:TRAP transporter fused permease subunit [Acuticoccus sediminis]RAI01987.1 C4-dicarboxylate ABC transporter permease [Acuticoccus sediminis]